MIVEDGDRDIRGGSECTRLLASQCQGFRLGSGTGTRLEGLGGRHRRHLQQLAGREPLKGEGTLYSLFRKWGGECQPVAASAQAESTDIKGCAAKVAPTTAIERSTSLRSALLSLCPLAQVLTLLQQEDRSDYYGRHIWPPHT